MAIPLLLGRVRDARGMEVNIFCGPPALPQSRLIHTGL